MRVDVDTFEDLYRRTGDPWQFATSPYEQYRYAVTVAHIDDLRPTRCFELGCSIGVLTEQLAPRSSHVVACDASEAAIARARERLAPFPDVELVVATVPDWWPAGTFDLIVASEIGYYWDEPDLRLLVERMRTSLEPDGHLLAVHWLGTSPDHLLTGPQVHTILRSVLGEPEQHAELSEVPPELGGPEQAGFVLDRWQLS
jgi:SAM-dependent methyltransferase